MKINKLSLAIMAASAMLAICPAVRAQDADTNKPPGESSTTHPHRAMSAETEMARIDKAVTLTDDEKPKVKAAVEDMIKAYKASQNADQEDRRAKIRTARKDFNNKMKDILTPDQYTKFQAMPRPGRRNRNGGGGQGGNGGTGAGQ